MAALWLGHRCDEGTLAPTQERFQLRPEALTRHAACLGMTGSGKTGMVVALLEEVALAGVPVIALDPKGDLANLALTFPALDGPSFAPWIDPAEAQRRGQTVDALADATATTWREGLARSGDDPARVATLRASVDVVVLTPGSRSGRAVDVLAALASPPAGLADDDEGRAAYAVGAACALLGLVGPSPDPLRDPAAILVARLLDDAWVAGRALPLDALLPAIVDPPFTSLGVFPLDTFFPRADRLDLALRLNALLASPAFAAWREGEPLDVAAWFTPQPGRTPLRVLYLAHLDDAQRMFFVTLLLHAVVAWSRRQPGTGTLRALLAFDEVMGFLPPHPHDPPSKAPVLTLLKQARAVGLGVVLCTQNPVDVDYKALSNAGTWLVGRMQTDQDRAKVVEGLTSAVGGLDARAIDQVLARLPGRTFVVRDPDAPEPALVATRFVLSYLRGPLTRAEVARLGGPSAPVAPASAPPPPRDADDGLPAPPPLPQGIEALWLDEAVAHGPLLQPHVGPRARPVRADGLPVYEPALQVRLTLRFLHPDGGVEAREEHRLFFPLDDGDPEPIDLELDEAALAPAAPGPGRYAPLHTALDEVRELDRFAKAVLDAALRDEVTTTWRHRGLKLTSRAGETEAAFRARVAAAVQERLDADVRALHTKVDAAVRKLEDAAAEAEADAARHTADASSHRTEQALHAGQALLGMFFGRSRSLTTVVSKQRQVSRAADRADRALEEAEAARGRMEDLKEEVEAKVAALEAEHRATLDAVEALPVRARKSDASVDAFRVVWIPVSRVL